jgi:hypothetical protein
MDKNIPKLFLSHSSLDKEFIEQLYAELRRCQIEPWLDTEEIRAGKPWLKVIFEEGIPTCDAVFVYYTENALGSPMVAKEVDTSLIQQMGDANINFIPYVESESVRRKLRPDIQSIQCPTLTKENYKEVFPQIVAEVWRTYHERSIPKYIAIEKSKRLELELKLKEIEGKQSSRFFTDAEESEYAYITKKLSEPLLVIVESEQSMGNEFFFRPLELLFHSMKESGRVYDHCYARNEIYRLLHKELNQHNTVETANCDRLIYKDPLYHDLQMYGFVEGESVERFKGRAERVMFYSNKMFRYRYWLDFNGKLPATVSIVRT